MLFNSFCFLHFSGKESFFGYDIKQNDIVNLALVEIQTAFRPFVKNTIQFTWSAPTVKRKGRGITTGV